MSSESKSDSSIKTGGTRLLEMEAKVDQFINRYNNDRIKDSEHTNQITQMVGDLRTEIRVGFSQVAGAMKNILDRVEDERSDRKRDAAFRDEAADLKRAKDKQEVKQRIEEVTRIAQIASEDATSVAAKISGYEKKIFRSVLSLGIGAITLLIVFNIDKVVAWISKSLG